MRKIYSLLAAVALLFSVKAVQAQSSGGSFTTAHDTVAFATGGAYNADNNINNTTASNITVEWRVISSDFPADWLGMSFGVCDNSLCYNGPSVWPGATTYSSVYGTGIGAFHLTIDLSTATSTGTHIMKIKLNNKYATNDTAIQTYIVTKLPASVSVVKAEGDVAIYPNPAVNELNVVYGAGADVKTIAVYNIIGKLMTVYKTSNNASANLNIESLSSGIYFVRLMNSRGDVVTTKKFTKQ